MSRVPPHSVEMEQALLGSLLLSPNDALWEFVSRYPAGESLFYDLRNAELFRVILDLANARKPVNIATVIAGLERLHPINPEQRLYVAALPDAAPSGASMSYYVDALTELFQRRRIIEVAAVATQKAYAGEADALPYAETEILGISATEGEVETSMKDLSVRVIDQLEEAQKNQGRLIGVPSGFVELDRKTRGFKPGQMIVIGARPGAGKTAIAGNIIAYTALEAGLPVGVFTLEMTKEEYHKRLLSSCSGVPSDVLEDGTMNQEQFKNVSLTLSRLSGSKIVIEDKSGLTINQLAARARRMVHRHKIKLLVVDYLQLLLPSKKAQNRTQELAEISTGVKTLAKDLGVPIIALAQLNRASEKDNREPLLSDLRDSGSIEQDADIVALLHAKPTKEESEDVPTDLLIRKHRNGPTGRIPMVFRKAITRFEVEKWTPPAPKKENVRRRVYAD